MGKVLLCGVVLCALVRAGALPVDDEVAMLRAKADYLDAVKNVLITNRCAIKVDSNEVPLTADALRSEGLVIAIGPNVAGQYLAYHRAPKPEQLSRVFAFAFPHHHNPGGGVMVVSAGLDISPGATKHDLFAVRLARPELLEDTDGLWWYTKRLFRMRVPTPGVHSEVSGLGPSGENVTVSCN